MRLSLFSLLFLSFSALAQLDTGTGADGACDETTPGFMNGGTFNCTTLSLHGTPAFTAAATALIIKVQGSVMVSGTINLSGSNGLNHPIPSGSFGGDGGPGAGNGGGDNSTTLPGSDASPSSGQNSVGGRVACEDGGGGGGFLAAGGAGIFCGSGISPHPGTGGSIVDPTEFSLRSILRGGYGGGAGGDSSAGTYGAGGGGGGFIRIISGGDITISHLAVIEADGGNGGPGGPDGGGGGGGSGGGIWLQAEGNILNDGVLHADGGTGGVATSGGNGGNGGHGLVRLEDSDGVIAGTGSAPIYSQRISIFPGSSLKSSIGCGTINEKDANSAFMQFVLSFILVVGFLQLSKKSSKLFS